MIKLGSPDGRLIAQLLELRHAAILEMTRRPLGQSCKEQAVELGGSIPLLTQIKAELPQITELEIAEPIKLPVAYERRHTFLLEVIWPSGNRRNMLHLTPKPSGKSHLRHNFGG